MKKLELITGAAALFAILYKIVIGPELNFLIIITILLLSLLYLYFGFALFNQIPLRKIFKREKYKGISALKIIGAIGLGICLSLLLLGILFTVMHWPGAKRQLTAGIPLLSIIFIIVTVKFILTRYSFYARALRRIAIIGGISVICLIIPQEEFPDAPRKEISEI